MSRSPSSRHANLSPLARLAAVAALMPPRTPVFKAFDKALNVWFEASTKAELLYLMNMPSVVARRQAAMQLKVIVDESTAHFATQRLQLAEAKRLRKRAHTIATHLQKET